MPQPDELKDRIGDQLFQDLFKNSTDAHLILENGTIIDCNEAALKMLRYTSKKDILTLPPSKLSPERQPDGRLSAEKSKEMVQIALECGSHRFEWIHRRSDGEEFPVEVLFTPLQFGEKQLIYTVWRDISDRINLIQTQTLLAKRVRELNCLSDIGHRIDEKPPLPDFLNWVCQRIPTAMRFPELCVAAITLNDEVFGSPETLDLSSKIVGGIRLNNELIGYVHIGYTEKRSFLDEESAFIGGIVGRVSSYIESMQFTSQIQQRSKELSTLNEMARSLSSLTDETLIAEVIYQNICQLVNVDDFYIAYYDEETQKVTFPLTYVNGQRIAVDNRTLGEGLTDYIIRHHSPLLLGENLLEEMNNLGVKFIPIGDGRPSLSWLGVPILYGDEVLGVINVQSVLVPNLYKEHDRDLLISVANHAAVSLKNARAFDQIQRALEENRQGRERYELAAAGSSDGLWDWLITKNEMYFSHRWKAMIGYSDEEISTSFSEFERRLHPEDHDRVMKAITDYLEGRIPIFVMEYRFQHKNGSYRWILARGALLRDENGVPVRMAGSHSDITYRRIAEFTIEKRAAELETVAKLSMIVSSILDSEKILQVVVDQAKREFVLYHVHIYRLDETEQVLLLSAGSGEVGRKMVDQKWQIPLNREHSIVAKVARERQGFIANDINAEPDFLPNEFLPDTRSEMAVPLIVGESLLGVLDVQSTEVNHFTEEDLSIQTTLASQIAIALQNSILYTEIQKALSETEASQKLLRSIMDATPDWIFVKDLEHRYRLVNKGFANSLHYHPAEIIGKNDLELGLSEEVVIGNPEKGIRGIWEDDQLVITSNEAQTFPNNPVQIDSVPHIFHTFKAPIHDANGQITGVLAFARDVTEREKLLAETEDRLRELTALQRTMSREAWSSYLHSFEHQNLGYVFDNMRTRLISTEEILSYQSSMGSRGPEIPSSNIFKTSLAVSGETVGYLGVNENPDKRLSEDEKFFMEAVADQVSQALERTRLIEQTQKSAVELQAVARVSSASSTILDPIQLLQSMVDLAKNSFGLYHAHVYLLDETGENLTLAVGAGEIGRQMVAKGWSIPIDQETIVTRAARFRQGQIVNDVHLEEKYLPNPFLPETHAELAIPMIVGNRLLGVFDAQSNRIDFFSEDDLRTYSTLASQTAIALQNAQLFADQAMTVERLRELDHLKSSFMANMSHELRTPLNSILGFTQVILEGIDGPLTNFMEADLQLIEKNGKHLLNLINEVLDMAKIESGRLNLTFEEVDLRELLGDVFETTSNQARDKNLFLKLDYDPYDDLVVSADQIRMRQVMLNLVGNAIKFTEIGGITVHISKVGEWIQVQCRDTGIGIPSDKLETVFEAFSQVDTSTTRKASGTGLGLPISRRLVEMHGGRLWAESKGVPGEGSTFHLDIPVHPLLK